MPTESFQGIGHDRPSLDMETSSAQVGVLLCGSRTVGLLSLASFLKRVWWETVPLHAHYADAEYSALCIYLPMKLQFCGDNFL